MLVLLVRHAESENNIVQAGVHAKLRAMQLNPTEAQEAWLANRYEDPGLSVNGIKQAAKLKKHIKYAGRHGVKRYVSEEQKKPILCFRKTDNPNCTFVS